MSLELEVDGNDLVVRLIRYDDEGDGLECEARVPCIKIAVAAGLVIDRSRDI